MGSSLNLPNININPGIGGQPVPQDNSFSDAAQAFLQAFLGSQQNSIRKTEEQGRNSRSSAELEEAKQRHQLEMQKLKIEQAKIDHQHTIDEQTGKTTQTWLEHVLPHLAATGGLQSLIQGMGMGGQDATMQAVGAAQGSVPGVMQQYGQQQFQGAMQNMDPEAANQFVQHILPTLMKMQESQGIQGGQAVQTGDTVTTFVPGKGFYDPATKTWGPSVERHQTPEQIAKDNEDRELRREQIATNKEYRTAIRAQSQTNQFVTRTRSLRERGMIINQAIQTISDAQNNPNPEQRRVLTSSAIANFVQASEQKAQLRYQMLMYFKNNVDPSIGGRWEVLKDRLIKGELPQYVTGGMLTHLNNLLKMSASEYEKQRDGEIKRHPELGAWLPESDEFFTAEHANATGATPPSLDAIPLPPPRRP